MSELLYNKTSLIKEIESRYGVKIPWTTLYFYERKGWLHASHKVDDGKRQRPIYTESDLFNFMNTLKLMKAEGKTRIKLSV